MKRIIGKINPEDRKVTIWGAGFSGLILGYYLKDQGYKVTIMERSSRVGGKIQTLKTQFGPVECGPNALYLNQDGLELLRDLKITPLPATKKLKRLLLIKGKPRRFFQLSLIVKFLLNALKKPPLIFDGLTVSDFFSPLLGQKNIDRYLTPILSGIYATSADQLHFKSIFPQTEKMAQFSSYLSFFKMIMKGQKSNQKAEIRGSVSFEGGMETLIDRLSEILKNEIKLNSKESISLKGNTIICTSAVSAAESLKTLRPAMSAELSRIRYCPLSTSTVFLKKNIRNLNRAFGLLIPPNGAYHSIGIINNKAVFPLNHKQASSYTFIAVAKLTKKDLIQDLTLLDPHSTEEDITHIEQTHWQEALPIYNLDLYLANRRLHQLGNEEQKLAIFGNYVTGISLRDMISAAKNFARNPNDYRA